MSDMSEMELWMMVAIVCSLSAVAYVWAWKGFR